MELNSVMRARECQDKTNTHRCEKEDKGHSRAMSMGIYSGLLKSFIIFVIGAPTSLPISYKNDLLTPPLCGR